MHFLDTFSKELRCIPVVSEYSASIAAEYFNESSEECKAFALVTAGPGLTNAVTGIAGAYLESRELLIIGGQVKQLDLNHSSARQMGIQEVDGVAIVRSITKVSHRVTTPVDLGQIEEFIRLGMTDRKGPVFLEVPLDVQASDDIQTSPMKSSQIPNRSSTNDLDLPILVEQTLKLLKESYRPILLIGGGVSRSRIESIYDPLIRAGLPMMTTWNGADRLGSQEVLYFGRPNTWGMRYSNILLQQADLVIAVGTRLGLQQTGFNFGGFVPNGTIVQVDIDKSEHKTSKLRDIRAFSADANVFLEYLIKYLYREDFRYPKWVQYCQEVKEVLPLSEKSNRNFAGFFNPYDFVLDVSRCLTTKDILIPSSSGSSMTVTMQSLLQPRGTRIITNKSLASMGYGLSGAIGAAFANPRKRIIHFEGDGGFAQNIQEIGTVGINDLNIKMFIWENNGYASIRMTQLNYFAGRYIGCDRSSGLGLPNLTKLFKMYDIPVYTLDSNIGVSDDQRVQALLRENGPAAFIVPIHPEQTFYPKISSRISREGGMESAPIHLMTPELDEKDWLKVSRYL